MTVHVLFSNRRVMQDGMPRRQTIQISANAAWDDYCNYPYIEVGCTTRKQLLLAEVGDPVIECLIRARRVIQFADAAELKASKLSQRHRNMVRRIEDHSEVDLDHLSAWLSSDGLPLLMAEPYCRWEAQEIQDLESLNIKAACLPVNCSPYCGGWDPLPAAEPKSVSYVLCEAKVYPRLVELVDRLETLSSFVPQWNDTTGVYCV